MIKIKTHKSAAKRFNTISSNKITRRNQSAQHLARRKSKRSCRNASKTNQLQSSNQKRIRKLLPGR